MEAVLPTLEGYEVTGLLGQGAMGSVYRGQRGSDGLPVAIKTLHAPDASAERALLNEGRLLSGLDHPHLCKVYDVLEHDGHGYLVMELVDGRPLTDWIEATPKEERHGKALSLLHKLAQGLRYLHTRTPPVIVRDLKPDNVLIMANERIKLIDFGIARALSENERTELLLKGFASVAYAPVEQYSQDGTTSELSDVYSLGATAFHLLAGKKPPTAIELISRKLDPVKLFRDQGVEEELAQVLGGAMQVRAENRVPLDSLIATLQKLSKPPPAAVSATEKMPGVTAKMALDVGTATARMPAAPVAAPAADPVFKRRPSAAGLALLLGLAVLALLLAALRPW